jgi:hypothetical protein
MQGRTMSRVYDLLSEKLTQPALAASRRRSLDLRSDADFSPEFLQRTAGDSLASATGSEVSEYPTPNNLNYLFGKDGLI